MASRFKELLQTVVNICVNSKDKYPELKEFLERIKIYADDLKEMKREIIMPINNDDYLRDVVLENKLLGMLFIIFNNNSQIWPPPAANFLGLRQWQEWELADFEKLRDNHKIKDIIWKE